MKKICVLLVACLFLLCGCGTQSMPEEEIPVSAEGAYYRTGAAYYNVDGKLVPIHVTAEWGDNVAQSFAEQLKNVSAELSQMGVSAAIPEDAVLHVTTENGHAAVDIANVSEEMSQTDTTLMLDAVSATLMQFEGITSVSFTINGNSETFGKMDISQPVSSVMLNPAYHIGDYSPFTVYYQTGTGLVLPVTKETANPCAEVYVNAMLAAPSDSSLNCLFPAGTKLNSSSLTDGVLSLDFSSEFYGVSALADAEDNLLNGLWMTCSQLEGVDSIKVSVDGVDYTTVSGISESSSLQSVFANQV